MSTSPLHGPLADPSASSSSSVPPHSFQTSPGTSSTTHYRSQTISKPDGQGGASWEVSEHDGVLHVQGVPLATTESDMRDLCEKRNISILSGIPSWSPRSCSEAGTANDGETAEVESAFPRHVAYVAFKCGSLRGQAFLELADPSQAPAAAALLNGMAIGSQRVVSVRVSSGTRRAKCMRAYANYLRGQHRVRLRGLRYEVVEADVREFLATAIGAEEASSPFVEVTLVRMGGETGPCSGDAFVRLRQAADVDLVLKLHGVKLGPRTVEVYESTEEDRQSIIRRSGRGDRGDGDNSHHGSVKSNRRNQHQNHHQGGGDGSQFKSNMVTPTPPMSFDSPRLSYSPGNKGSGGNHNNSVLLSPMQMLDGTQCWTPVPTVAAGGDASLYFPPVQYSVAGSSQLYPLSSGTLNNMVTANIPSAAMAPGTVQPLAMPYHHPGFFPSVGTASTSTTTNTPTAGMPQVVDWGTFNNANSSSISPSSNNNNNNNNSINANNFNHSTAAMARSPFVLHVGCMPMGVTEAQVREHFRGVHIMPAGYHPFFLRYYNNSSYSLDAFIEVMSMEDVGAALLFNNRPMMESSLITVRCSSSQELMSTGLLNNNNTNAIMGHSSMNQNVMVGAASNAAAMVPQTQQQQQQQPLTFFLMPRVFA